MLNHEDHDDDATMMANNEWVKRKLKNKENIFSELLLINSNVPAPLMKSRNKKTTTTPTSTTTEMKMYSMNLFWYSEMCVMCVVQLLYDEAFFWIELTSNLNESFVIEFSSFSSLSCQCTTNKKLNPHWICCLFNNNLLYAHYIT